MTLTETTSESATPLAFDPAEFRRSFNRKPFYVGHSLVGHPLFELPRLMELARSLPVDRVEYNAGNVPITLDPTQTPRTGLSIEETIRRIEECQSWMVLKNVESDPDYRGLLSACLAPMAPFVSAIRGMESFVFISSPGSVTPFHIDPECNFLLQIRGTKTIRMFPMDDPELLTEEELERFYSGASRNLICRDEQGDRAMVFDLEPGQGLHFPVTIPHWVKNGPAVSISFSVTFRTPQSDRREILYRINHQLRKMGMKPTPVGRSVLLDSLKFGVFDIMRLGKKLMRGREESRAVKY